MLTHVARHQQLDVVGWVPRADAHLPRRRGARLEYVDFAMLLWEGVVVARRQSHATGVVAQVEVDAWEFAVRRGRHGGVWLAIARETLEDCRVSTFHSLFSLQTSQQGGLV